MIYCGLNDGRILECDIIVSGLFVDVGFDIDNIARSPIHSLLFIEQNENPISYIIASSYSFVFIIALDIYNNQANINSPNYLSKNETFVLTSQDSPQFIDWQFVSINNLDNDKILISMRSIDFTKSRHIVMKITLPVENLSLFRKEILFDLTFNFLQKTCTKTLIFRPFSATDKDENILICFHDEIKRQVDHIFNF